MNNATEKTTRNYITHTYAPGMTKEEKSKQRRATRAALKSQAHENVAGTPTPVLKVEKPSAETERANAAAEANRKNLREALNRKKDRQPATV